METTATFSHNGNIGDVFAAIPAMREYHKKTGKKIILYLEKDVKAFYYEGATHPTKTDGGNVMLNQQVIDMMKPLLMAQDFMEDVKTWVDERVETNLSEFRNTYVGMPNFSINRWIFYVYPDLACDLSGVWMQVPDAEKDFAKGKIIITRSERYNNDRTDYSFLKQFEDDLIFSGTMREYNNFCMRFDLNIKKLAITNFLDLAQAIKQSRFHISNQTAAYQISQGIKKPSILELCGFAPNCIPIGEDCYDFFAQPAVEYYFGYLNEKTANKGGF